MDVADDVDPEPVQPLNTKAESVTTSIPPGELSQPNKGLNAGSAETTAEQRTRDWAAQHSGPSVSKRRDDGEKRTEVMSEIEIAGQEMREADERDRRKKLNKVRSDLDRDTSNFRMRTVREMSHEGSAQGVKAMS